MSLERIALALERQELHSLEAEAGIARPVGLNAEAWRAMLEAHIVERRFRNVLRIVGEPDVGPYRRYGGDDGAE